TVMAVTIGFIGLASLYRTSKLRSGGGAVAKMMGGRLVDPGTRDKLERRLVNVVEEMSIASGVPVPEIYVMDQEKGINAFAAGFTPENAAVAVTRGTLEQLNRDQLQGVLAHEFSHILNGDMRLNIRLIGVLFGILAIAIVGRFLLYSSSFSRRSKDNAVPMLVGITLFAVGYIGVFIGRLIQSAVSRQREFLADSSAVQFTRNPNGIAGALKRIAGYKDGSYLRNPGSTEVGHLLFGQGDKISLMAGLLATHPPLEERIRRIDPSFKPELAERDEEGSLAGIEAVPAAGLAAGFGGARVKARPHTVVDRVGSIGDEELKHGANLVAGVPASLRDALQTAAGARRLIYALLLDADGDERAKQVRILQDMGGKGDADGALALFDEMSGLDRALRLPLADLAMPALRLVSKEEAKGALAVVDALVTADGKVTLFEFALRWMLSHRLRGKGRGRVVYTRLSKVAGNITHLLAGMARAGNPDDPSAASQAFKAGLGRVGIRDTASVERSFEQGGLGSLEQVGQAMDRLSLASYGIKEKVIDAAAHCALADQVVTLDEAELLRLVAISLDCPLPPFVAGQM
ncbi:MAG: M48 family metallopeptidase, partial [Deltaproteobacteria bacterium]|nr:M48 family metallopeptidase [Deltaproteobacteria bacterium]